MFGQGQTPFTARSLFDQLTIAGWNFHNKRRRIRWIVQQNPSWSWWIVTTDCFVLPVIMKLLQFGLFLAIAVSDPLSVVTVKWIFTVLCFPQVSMASAGDWWCLWCGPDATTVAPETTTTSTTTTPVRIFTRVSKIISYILCDHFFRLLRLQLRPPPRVQTLLLLQPQQHLHL